MRFYLNINKNIIALHIVFHGKMLKLFFGSEEQNSPVAVPVYSTLDELILITSFFAKLAIFSYINNLNSVIS